MGARSPRRKASPDGFCSARANNAVLGRPGRVSEYRRSNKRLKNQSPRSRIHTPRTWGECLCTPARHVYRAHEVPTRYGSLWGGFPSSQFSFFRNIVVMKRGVERHQGRTPYCLWTVLPCWICANCKINLLQTASTSQRRDKVCVPQNENKKQMEDRHRERVV